MTGRPITQYQGDGNFDLSSIFIAREQQLDLFDIYLTRWKRILFDADHDLDTPVLASPSPNIKLQGLIVLLYGRGGFGKSTLLEHYRGMAQEEGRNITVSAIVDWEFAVEGKRGLFNPPPGQEVDAAEYFRVLCTQLAIALKKDPKAFKEYQAAVKAVDEARKKASGVLESMQKDDRYAAFRTVTVEGLMTVGRSIVPGGGALLDNPAVKAAADAGLKITAEQLSHLRIKLHATLGDKLSDYLDSSLRLGLAVGRDLSEFARNFPVLVFFDTYEEVDEADHLLRIVMGAAGQRVGWVIAGRDNLWAGTDQVERSVDTEYGYKDLVPSDRGFPVNFNVGDIGSFTINDIQRYFDLLHQMVGDEDLLPIVTRQAAARIQKITQGVPLAVKIAAGLYLETANLEWVTEQSESKRHIVDKMVRRYLLHTRADQGERVKLFGLAMIRRADQPPTVAAALRLSSEQARFDYESELSRLQRRYSFIFTEKAQPALHQEVRYFLRLWLLEHRKEPEIVAVNTRLKEAHESALKQLEAQMQYVSLEERLQDEEWVDTYLDLTEQQFWLDPMEGVRHILPFMIAAAIYRRDINEDAMAVGTFFETQMRGSFRQWWAWATQSSAYVTSRGPSQEELISLEALVQLAEQRCPSFPQLLPDYRKELEAALWWRLGAAYKRTDGTKALGWYEKALTRLEKQAELKNDAAEVARNLAKKLYTEKKYTECVPIFNRAIELNPNLAFVYIDLGMAHHNLNEYQWAIQDHDRAIELDPNYAFAYSSRSDTYKKLGEYQRAIQDCERAIELIPNDAYYYSRRGMAYDDLKEHQRAIQDYDRAIELDPNHAYYFSRRGMAYDDLEEHQRAIRDYNRAIELDPNDAYYFSKRGDTYKNLKEHQRAIQDYDRVIELDPNYILAHHKRGDSYYELKEYQRAILDFEEAIKFYASYAITYYQRGNAHLWLKHISQARADFERSYELDPTDINSAWMAEWAKMSEQRISVEGAVQLETIAAIDPESYQACICRGIGLGLRGKGKEGLGEMERAIALSPEEWDAFFWKGMLSAYYYQGRSHGEELVTAIEQSLANGLPPILLTPLYWLEKDRPKVFEKYARPLLQQYSI